MASFIRNRRLSGSLSLLGIAVLLALSGISGCGSAEVPAADTETDPTAEMASELAAQAGVPGVADENGQTTEAAADATTSVETAESSTAPPPRKPAAPSSSSDSSRASRTPFESTATADRKKSNSDKAAAQAAAEALPETPDEIIAAIRKALKPAAKSKKNSAKKTGIKQNEPAPVELTPAERSKQAIELSAKLLAHQNATDDQRAEAWRSKLKFLSRGVKAGWAGYSQQLTAAVAMLNKSPQFAEEAEYGNGLLLVTQYFGSDTPAWKAVEKITEFAHRFPNGSTGLRMYLAYAGTLMKRGDRLDAERCCNVALWELKDHPEIERVRDFATLIPAMKATNETARIPQTALQRQLEAEVEAIRAKLPIKLDPVTTLTEIATGPHSINYRYEIAASRSDIMARQNQIEKSVSAAARQTLQTRLLLKGGVVLNYVYCDKNGALLFYFSVKGL